MSKIKQISIFFFFSLMTVAGFAQDSTISGVVKDNIGSPLPGVSIAVKGTPNTTITDFDGKYSLNITDNKQVVLVFSFVSMLTQEVKYTGQKPLNVVLQENVNELNEIVVTGVQSIDKKDATGSYSILNQKTLKPIYSTNFINKLEGSTTGLYIDKNNNITIRGMSTINANTKPLIVVDGLPLESSELNLNPVDIEQITVLKDAASASIWGIRAANGVVVITTKRGGKSKDIKVNYSSNLTFSEKVNLNDLHILSSDQYVNLLFEDYNNNTPYTSGTSGGEYNDVEKVYMKLYNNEISNDQAKSELTTLGKFSNRKQIEDNFYRQAYTLQHTISMQAGGEKTSTYLSLNFDQNNSRLVGDEYKKVNLMLNSDFNFTDNFRAKLGIRGANKWEKANGTDAALAYEPWQRILNDDQSYYDESFTTINRTYQESLYALGFKDWSRNILQNMRMNDKKRNGYDITTSLALEWEPIKNLKFSTQGTYEFGKDEASDYYSPDHYFVRNLVNKFTEVKITSGYPVSIVENHLPVEGGIKDITNTNLTSFSLRNKLSYKFNIKDFQFDALLGNDIYSLQTDTYGDRLWGYNDNYLTSNTINLTQLNNGVRGYNGKVQKLSYAPTLKASLERYTSWFGTTSIGYKNLYNLFGSARLDQTNLLVNATEFRNNPSWSVSAKWSLSNESFFKKNNTVTNLAFRFSYGLSGNIDKTTTPDITGVFNKDYTVRSLNVLTIENPANPSLGWEKTYISNLGVDALFFNNNWGLTLDVYNRKSANLLSLIKNDATTGWTSFNANSATMTNRGFEAQLKGKLLKSRDFEWNSTLNFTYNHNKVTDYKYSTSALSSVYGSIVAGRPLNQLSSIRYGGLDDNGAPTFLKKGDDTKYSYTELSTITQEDLIDEGTSTPPFFGSFYTTLDWKKFTLGVMLTYEFGHKMRMPSASISGGLYTEWAGESYRWIEGADNSGKTVPRLFDGSGGNEWAPSAYWDTYNYSNLMTEDASVVRLRSVRLDYDLSSVLNLVKISGGSVGISAENLCYWAANSKNLDPNTVSSSFFGYVTGLSTSARFLLNFNINF